MRLVGGSNANEGRIEVFFNDVWGSVCVTNNDFSEKDAAVVCRQLGLPSSNTKVTQDSATNPVFGMGSEPFWLTGVSCVGSESSLDKCSHLGWGIFSSCSYREAGVICANGMCYRYSCGNYNETYNHQRNL